MVLYDQSSVPTEKHPSWKEDSEGCSLAGAGQWSSSTFKEIAAADDVSDFSFAVSERYE